MSQEIENKCCGQQRCVTVHSRFHKLQTSFTLLSEIGETSGMTEKTTAQGRKAAYRQYILDRYGYLGKGNRKVCSPALSIPDCSLYGI